MRRTSDSGSPESWPATSILIGLIAVAVLTAAMALATTVRAYTALPLQDQWATVAELERFAEDGPSARWFVAQHNEHRLAVPRLFFLVDAYAFGARNLFLLVSIYLVQLLQAGMLILVAHHGFGFRGRRLIAFAAIASALVFNPLQQSNFVWGFQIQFVGVYLGAAVTLGAMLRSLDTTTLRHARLWLLGSLVSGLATSYTMASGVLIWPSLAIVVAVQRPVRVRALGAVIVSGALTLAAYLDGYVSPASHADPIESLFRPWDVLYYTACYLGSPMVSIDEWTAPLVGGLGLLGLTALVAVPALRPRHSGQCFCVGLMLFIAGGALLTGLGRLDLGFEQALSRRYATPALIFWACGLLLAAGALSRSRWTDARPGRSTRLAAAALFALIVLGRGGYISARGYSIWPEELRRSETAILAGDPEPADLAWVSPYDPTFTRERIAFLRERRWSVFGGGVVDGR